MCRIGGGRNVSFLRSLVSSTFAIHQFLGGNFFLFISLLHMAHMLLCTIISLAKKKQDARCAAPSFQCVVVIVLIVGVKL